MYICMYVLQIKKSRILWIIYLTEIYSKWNISDKYRKAMIILNYIFQYYLFIQLLYCFPRLHNTYLQCFSAQTFFSIEWGTGMYVLKREVSWFKGKTRYVHDDIFKWGKIVMRVIKGAKVVSTLISPFLHHMGVRTKK